MSDKSPRYASPKTAAKYADVTPRTVHNWISRGLITAYRSGARIVRVDLNEIDAMLSVSTAQGGAK